MNESAPPTSALSIDGLTITLPNGRRLFDNASLDVKTGECGGRGQENPRSLRARDRAASAGGRPLADGQQVRLLDGSQARE